MQVVIDIPEKMYKDCKVRNTLHYSLYDFSSMIVNGTPLPKHGRLIDADKLKEVYENTEDAEYCKWTLYGVTSEIDGAETVIEADKAESEVQDAK